MYGGALLPSLGMTEQRSTVKTQMDKAASTALAAITNLSADLVSGVTYEFDLDLILSLDGTGGYKVDLAGGTATGSTVEWIVSGIIFAVGNPLLGNNTALATTFNGAGPTFMYARICGYIVCNGSGTLIPRFAQNSASGTSSVFVGSKMKVRVVP